MPERNPFTTKVVAEEWIRSIEGERGFLRDREVYPRLRAWSRSIKTGVIVEIGAGQGICSSKMDLKRKKYVGVEPSRYLVDRAHTRYTKKQVKFVIGDAYQLPQKTASVDGVFSVNVWFHLARLERASKEMSRILKLGSPFLMISANPYAYGDWELFYLNYKKIGKKIIGKVDVPINPLSENIFYQHSLSEIIRAFEKNKLAITIVETFGLTKKKKGPLFISILGYKV